MTIHGPSEIGNAWGGYDCVCGGAWLDKYGCTGPDSSEEPMTDTPTPGLEDIRQQLMDGKDLGEQLDVMLAIHQLQIATWLRSDEARQTVTTSADMHDNAISTYGRCGCGVTRAEHILNRLADKLECRP